MGFASSPETRDTLAGYGIRVGGYRWRWGLGLKGGTFPPHYHQNNEFVSDSGEFPALPGEDVNGDTCACNLVPVYRDQSGRFAKPGLEPVFQTPFVASAQLVPAPTVNVETAPVDFSPLVAALGEQPPIYVNVTTPQVEAPRLDFASMPATVVNVPETVVNVAAPNVTVSPAEVVVNLPTVEPVPTFESTYFAGVSGVVKLPKGHRIASWSAMSGDKPAVAKVGSATITIPPVTGYSDELDDAPLDVRSVTFRNTVAYTVRTVH